MNPILNTALTNTQALPTELAGIEFQFVDSVFSGMLEASFDLNKAMDSAALGLARFNVEIKKWQIESFKYHYPVAKYWASKIKSDPRWVTNQILQYFETNLFSLKHQMSQQIWLSYAPPSWLAGDTRISACALFGFGGLSGYYAGTMILNQKALQDGSALQTLQIDKSGGSAFFNNLTGKYQYSTPELLSAATKSPYGGDFAMANFDYLCFPLPLICAICSTDDQAFKNAMAILFSKEIMDLQDRIIRLAKSFPKLGVQPSGTFFPGVGNSAPTLNWTDEYNYLLSQASAIPFISSFPKNQQQNLIADDSTLLTLYTSSFLRLYLPTYFRGPRFLLPYAPDSGTWNPSDLPPVASGYSLYLSCLKGSSFYSKYLGPIVEAEENFSKTAPSYWKSDLSYLQQTGTEDITGSPQNIDYDLNQASPLTAPSLPLLTATQKNFAWLGAGLLGAFLLFGRKS